MVDDKTIVCLDAVLSNLRTAECALYDVQACLHELQELVECFKIEYNAQDK